MAIPFGSLLAYLFPLIFTGDHKEWTDLIKQDELGNIWNYILFQNILITALAIPIIFLIREKP